jgi:hypothetical protein
MDLGARTGARRQLDDARDLDTLPSLVERLSSEFMAPD